jgi:hypothetical protein
VDLDAIPQFGSALREVISAPADALLVRGVAVSEITSGIRTRPHSLTAWADVKGTDITYPRAVASHELPAARRPHQR